jgi:hypothetical protein
MLVYYIFMFALLLHLLFNVDHHGDRSRSCAHAFLSKRRPITVMLASPIRLCYFFLFNAPEWFQIAGRYLSIAICHLIWLYSRKYGTVWYHPASSKLWNLTTLSFVNFQGKLTGTSCDLYMCEASLFGLLCAWR